MRTHELKIAPDYFTEVATGDKTFEIRYNDRGYQKGDIVHLKPYDCGWVEPYKGLKFEITYVIGYNQKENWVVFSIKPLKEETDDN